MPRSVAAFRIGRRKCLFILSSYGVGDEFCLHPTVNSPMSFCLRWEAVKLAAPVGKVSEDAFDIVTLLE